MFSVPVTRGNAFLSYLLELSNVTLYLSLFGWPPGKRSAFCLSVPHAPWALANVAFAADFLRM